MHPSSQRIARLSVRRSGGREQSAQFGEKGRLGALITGAAVFAFAASNLYVCGLSLSIHQNLANYFEILDYIQITPAWALPAFLVSLLTLAYFGFSYLMVWMVRRPRNKDIWDKTTSFLILLNGLGVLALGILAQVIPRIRAHSLTEVLAGSFLIPLGASWAVVTLVLILLHKWRDFRIMQFMFGPHYRWVSAFAIGILCFAFLCGAVAAPSIISASPEATISISREHAPSTTGSFRIPYRETTVDLEQNESKMQGRIVFKLSHSLIVITDLSKRILVVVPEAKVEKVETPAAEYVRQRNKHR